MAQEMSFMVVRNIYQRTRMLECFTCDVSGKIYFWELLMIILQIFDYKVLDIPPWDKGLDCYFGINSW